MLPDAATGSRRADKLVRVWRHDGTEAWVLIHLEVQNQPEADFAERMYVYNYRIFDHHRRQVCSIAVLGDTATSWRPDRFGYELWGSRSEFRYPVLKLSDWRGRWNELESSSNPIATVVMAHLKTQETRSNALERQGWKLALIKRLYGLGYAREQIAKLFKLIDLAHAPTT